tara:strand:- start:91 stop:192 length:102 start_codon:yes stop_codon:yes gene_type:complete
MSTRTKVKFRRIFRIAKGWLEELGAGAGYALRN